MATIPEPGVPSVAPSAMPTPYGSPAGVTPDAFGAPLGRLLQNDVAPTAEAIYLREKRKADESATTAALGQGQQALNAITDPATGYFSLKGYDALAAKQKTIEDFDKSIAKINTSLNHDQQLLFAHPAAMLRNEALHHIQSHEGQQIHVADAANTKGAVDALSRSLQTPAIASDPNEVEVTMAKLKGTLTSGAQRQLGESATADAIASLVGPGMQKGAMDAMNGALATESPAVATAVYQKVGQYLGEHEHTYGNFVRSLAAKQQIATESANLIAAGAQQVAMPDGTLLPRVDGAKVAAARAKLGPETPNLAEITKAADTQEKVLGDLWSKSVGTVYERVYSAGQNPVTGEFDLQSPKIDPKDKAWLSQFASGKLTDLKNLGDKSQRGDKAAAHEASLEALSQLSSDMHDPQNWAATYAKMTSGQFLTLITSPQFADLAGPERLRAQRLFDANKAAESKLEEPIGRTVKAQIAEAFPGDERAVQRRKFSDQYFEALRAAAQTYVNGEKAAGRKVDSDAVAKFIDGQLAKVPSGSWYIRDKRQIEINAAVALQPPAAPPPTAAATPVAVQPKGFAGYRYTSDRKTRYPADAQGNVLGPGEPVP